MTAASPLHPDDEPDTVWTLADDPEEEVTIWQPEDPGASDRTFRS